MLSAEHTEFPLCCSCCLTTQKSGISQHIEMCFLLLVGIETPRDPCGDVEGDKNTLLMIIFGVQIAACCSD